MDTQLINDCWWPGRFPWWLSSKEFTCNAGDTGLTPGSGISVGEGNGNPLTILAWRIPWTEEPDGLQSIESDMTEHTHLLTVVAWEQECWPSKPQASPPRAHLITPTPGPLLPPYPGGRKALYSAGAFSMQQNLNSTGIFTPVAAQEAVTLEAKRGRKKRRGNSQPRGSFHSCPASQ